MTRYFSGQGKVYLSTRDVSGNPVGFAFLGNCPEFVLSAGRAGERFATAGGETPGNLVKGSGEPVVSMVLDELTRENLARALYGAVTPVAGSTVSNEVVTAKLGFTAALANIGVSAVVVRNSALSTTYVSGVDYILNAGAGSLSFPASGSAITDAQSLRVSYTFAAYDFISAFTTAPSFFWLRFEGLNTAVAGTPPCVVDVFKVKLLPTPGLSLISDGISAVQVTANSYKDDFRNPAVDGGYYFRLRQQ